MKLLTRAMLLCLLFSALRLPAQIPVRPLQEIYYPVQVRETDQSLLYEHWYHQNIEASVHYSFLRPLFERIKQGTLQVYKPVYPYDQPLSPAALKSLLHRTDTVITEDISTGKQQRALRNIELKETDIGSLGFYESWRYDSIALTMEKDVKGMVFYSQPGQALFYLPLNAPDATIKSPQLLAVPLITYTLRIKNFDVATRESQWWNENLEPSKRFWFMNSLFEPALNGKLQVFESSWPFTSTVTASKLNERITLRDSVYIEDPNYMEIVLTIIERRTSVFDLNWIGFHETWYFDPVKLAMYKQVKGLMITKELRNETGEIVEYRSSPLFYVPVNGTKNDPTAPAVIVPRIDYMAARDTTPIDTINWNRQMSALISSAQASHIPVYEPAFINNKPNPHAGELILPGKVSEHLNFTDSLYILNPATNKKELVIKQLTLDPSSIQAIDFSEEWTFDPANYHFTKKVIAIEPWLYHKLGAKETAGAQRPFRVNMKEVNELELAQTRFLLGSDIETSATIDGRDSAGVEVNTDNWWYMNLEPSKRTAIVQQWLNDIASGKITVYDAIDRTQKLSEPEAKNAIRVILPPTDEDYVLNSFDPLGTIVPVHVTDIPSLKFHEAWYFDAEQNAFLKKVKGVTLQAVIDKRVYPLVYIPLNR